MYFYGENYILPFSHDEVVHGKHTILDKMWGDNDQKFAQCKALYVYMMTHPGKKLNFMGNELAEYKEWDEKKALGWNLLKYPQHDSFNRFFGDLNHIVLDHPSLYQYDYYPEGFEWLVVDDKKQSVFAYARKAPNGDMLITVLNFVGNTHKGYTVPVPVEGSYKEILNTDKDIYTGGNYVNKRVLKSKKMSVLGKENAIMVDIAPFSGIIFELKKENKKATK
jgi:1,4-alpha-glucan branching enzyme